MAELQTASTGSSLSSRNLRVTFRLLANAFGPDGQDTVTLTGLRISAEITQAQFPTGDIALLRIEGLSPDLMNRLSLAAPDPSFQSASDVRLEASDGTDNWAVVFQGAVTLAYADYTNAPNVAFMVQAFSTALLNAMPATPTSFRSAVSLATVLSTIAQKAGLTYAGYGVDAITLHNPYFDGSPGQQLAQCAETVPLRLAVGRGQITASTVNTQQQTQQPIVVSAQNGLIGYPSWSSGGLALRMMFNPQVTFNTVIALQSRYQPAGWGTQSGPVPTGLWQTTQVRHMLQSEMADGAWFTNVIAQTMPDGSA
ncbi:hypothetical protein AA0313_0901 [Acetobacter indonesiensis NRIC 0313]|uniref:Uncharacterized protein n=1 Tax=Acetobacter indonesiensis TaxID=104101 RepID=A0A6N3T5K3_9PROT|nr:hypothetical protein [Acetobacter indonesiensis]GAN63194.1 hypothetical protein Abin_022_052 [Acetobacter indonesiensis]GBQ55600.1 hypothetical protein AA0313_0901 [Acetobacter indonesiensis NRIC 0313]GEN04143.1 hypothetical protein AIN02nite_21680 [Acetobacter indonesiensis]